MTLDEAIKHAEEVAEEQKELYRLCPASESEIFHCDGTKDCKTLENGKNKGCQKCSEEHRQLAEWLRELKRYHQAKDGLLEDMKALNCGFPYGLDYLIECIKKRLQEVLNEDNITGWPF